MSNCTLIDFHGHHRVEWMLKVFGECVHTPMEKASFYIGLSSIGFWLFANFPQIYTNYKNSNASSLHVAFLVQWILGDSLNLIGAILTGQLATQIATAIYYITMDVILVSQWTYYHLRDAAKKNKSTKTSLQSALYLVFVFILLSMLFSSNGTLSPFSVLDDQPIFGDDDNDPGPDEGWPPKGAMEIIGYIIGVFSAVLYLGSRIPQILKNFFRRSTEGLSPMLFFCAFMGNVTYSVSIFLYSTRKHFLLGKLPWIVGSAGVLVLDFTILMQFVLFKFILKTEKSDEHEHHPDEVASLIGDHSKQEKDHHHEEHVLYNEQDRVLTA